jgi:AcrR family transcriptional regulator
VTRQQERRAATRAWLLAAARPLFADRGFHGVAADEIVAAVGLTRGALYHHFGGKDGLFAAVVEDLQAAVAARIAAAATAAPDPWSALVAGCRAFLEAGLDPAARRILLLDAPAVLGWDRWRDIDERHGFRLLVDGLRAAMAAGDVDPQPAEPLARLLTGAMNEAALWAARAEDPDRATADAVKALEAVLAGLRRAAPAADRHAPASRAGQPATDGPLPPASRRRAD